MKRPHKQLLLAVTIVPVLLVTGGTELRRARTLSSELAAEARIRTIHAAESEYKDEHGRYAGSLRELRLPDAIEGYGFALSATPSGYSIQAGPKRYFDTGRRTFFSDQTTVIRENQIPR